MIKSSQIYHLLNMHGGLGDALKGLGDALKF